MPNPTAAKIGESGLVFAKNKTTNQVETIASTADMQVGLPGQPADLLLNGALSLNTLDLTLAADSTKAIPDSSTNINVTTTGASGTATISLPASPKKGQLVYIKDIGGTASAVSITVVGSSEGTKTIKGTRRHLIDGSSSKTITTNHGALQLLWTGTGWSTVSTVAPPAAPIDASYVVLGSNSTLTGEKILTAGSGISIVDGGSTVTISASGAGLGNVTGPLSSTDNAVVRFDGITGELIQDSAVTIADSTGNITTPGDIAVNGGDITTTAATFNIASTATSVNLGASTADLTLANVEIGAWPAGTSYAFFGHKDYDHSIGGNYALIQASPAGTKNTWLNAPTGGKIYFANNDDPLGYLDNNEISLTGKSGTAQTVTIGTTTGASSLDLKAGTGDVTLESGGDVVSNPSDQFSTRFQSSGVDLGYIGYYSFFGYEFSTISLTGKSGKATLATLGSTTGTSSTEIYGGTGGIVINSTSTTSASAIIGQAEVGTHPYWGVDYAMFGHGDYDHYGLAGKGNYALLAVGSGASKHTWLNAPSGGRVYFANNDSALGYLDDNEISLTGKSSTAQTVTLGTTYGASSTTINAGTGNLALESGGDIILDPSYQFSTYFQSSGENLGYIGYYNVLGNEFSTISLTGKSGKTTFTTLGNSSTGSITTIQAGTKSGDSVILDGYRVWIKSRGYELGYFNNILNTSYIYLTGSTNSDTVVNLGNSYGASSLTLDAGLGTIAIGTSDSSRSINIGTASTQKQEITIGNDVTGTTTSMLAGGSSFGSGIGNMYLSGASGTSYYLGGETGTGNIEIGRSTAANTINIGAAGNNTSNAQNINIGSGTGKSIVVVGSQSGASSLALDSGTGNTAISSTGQISFSLDGYQMGYLNRDYNAIGGFYYDEIYLTGRNNVFVTEPTYLTIGSSYNDSSITINAGTGYTTINGHTIIARSALVSTYPSATVTEFPLEMKTTSGGNTYRWAIGADFGYDLNFSYSLNSTTVASRGYLANTVDVGNIDFTGQHRNYPVGGNVLDYADKVGLIVVSNGQYKSLTSGSTDISINEALPLVELSTRRNQKSAFGVVSDHEDPSETSREYVMGSWGSVYEKRENDDRLIINSLGEGGIWVCDVNGALENGDFITTCEIPGYGMRQDDDLLHSYTVAKITCECGFDLRSSVYRCEKFEHEGKTYRRAFVGCTYHCG